MFFDDCWNDTSKPGKQPEPVPIDYGLFKIGVLHLTKALAKSYAPKVRVNAVSPGFIESGSAPIEELSKMIKNIPAGYVGSVEDAASTVCYLLSDEARYINGANIHLSGAWGV